VLIVEENKVDINGVLSGVHAFLSLLF
jgi:hypothetical protein